MTKKEMKERISAIEVEIRSVLESAKADQDRGFDDERQSKVNDLKAERAALIEQYTLEMFRELDEKLSRQNNEKARAEVFMQAFNEAASNPTKTVVLSRAALTMNDVQSLAPLNIGEVIEPLEKGVGFDEVGCRIQYGLDGDWLYPVLPTIEATLNGETTSLSDTKITLGSVKPVPSRVAISAPISRSTLHKSADVIMNVITFLLQMGINMFISKWLYSTAAISGSDSTSISGPFVSPGVTKTYNGEKPSYEDLIGLKGAVKATGIRADQSAGYVMSATTAAALEATPITVGDSRCIITDGRLGGVPVHTSEYVEEGTVLFGYFSYALVGQFGDMSLVVDPYSAAKSNTINVVINSDWDIKAARAEAFGKLTKAGA